MCDMFELSISVLNYTYTYICCLHMHGLMRIFFFFFGFNLLLFTSWPVQSCSIHPHSQLHLQFHCYLPCGVGLGVVRVLDTCWGTLLRTLYTFHK